MGIYDRDYMREDDPADRRKSDQSLKRWLIIGILAVLLLTALLYFARNAGFGRTKRAEKLSLKVNINKATEEELETLPGTVRLGRS